MTNESSWESELGPFYREPSLKSRGIDDVEALIGLTTLDGVVVYPEGQFDRLPDEKLQPRQTVIALWKNQIAPEITLGHISEWTAASLLLGVQIDGTASRADLLAGGEVEEDVVVLDIARFFFRWNGK